MSEEMREHILADNTKITHSHSHGHIHLHKETKQVQQRLNNIIGHLHGISNMVQEGRDCSDVLVQLSAVSASIKSLKGVILKDHVEHCIVDAVKHGDEVTVKKLKDAIEKMLD